MMFEQATSHDGNHKGGQLALYDVSDDLRCLKSNKGGQLNAILVDGGWFICAAVDGEETCHHRHACPSVLLTELHLLGHPMMIVWGIVNGVVVCVRAFNGYVPVMMEIICVVVARC